MQILASLVKGLNIHLANIFIKVNMGLRGSIGVIFIVKAGSLITDSSTIQQHFLFNKADVVKANIFINYTVSTAD